MFPETLCRLIAQVQQDLLKAAKSQAAADNGARRQLEATLLERLNDFVSDEWLALMHSSACTSE